MKKEPMGNEREQDAWLGNTLRRSAATAPDGCLDAETLAAWADGGLNAKAAEAVELHASSCSRCMAVLATMERTAPRRRGRRRVDARACVSLGRAARGSGHCRRDLGRRAGSADYTGRIDDSQDLKSVEQVPVPVPIRDHGTGTLNQNPEPEPEPEPGTWNAEPGTTSEASVRDELRRERASGQSVGSVAATCGTC